MANAKNLASGTLVNSISASETSLTVFVGNGSTATITGVWPTAPFYATILPSQPVAGVANYLDSEIVYVTSVSTDGSGNTVLTVSRGQRATTAKTFSAGAIVTCAVYADDATLLGGVATPETPTPWITYDDLVPNTLMERIGTDDNFALKYADGTLICCVKKDFVTGSTSQWGSQYMYVYDYNPNTTYQVPFIVPPAASIYAGYSAGLMSLFVCTTEVPSVNYAPRVTLARPSEFSGKSITYNCIAIGRWK